MPKLEGVLASITELRIKIDDMTENSGLTDPDLMYVSRMLDGVLDECQNFMTDKINRS